MGLKLPFSGTYPLTQSFGVNPQDYAQFGMKGHNGLDFGLPTGTPVRAAEDGHVTLSTYDGLGFGNYIEITGTYKTLYAHLDYAVVGVGAQVQQGQIIGYSDNTGNSSGPHLHFGVKPLNPDKANGFFGAIDPAPLLKGDDMVITRVMFNMIWRGFFDEEPPQKEVDYWVGRSDAAEFEKYLTGLYAQNEARRWKANHYDADLAAARAGATSDPLTAAAVNFAQAIKSSTQSTPNTPNGK